MDWNNINFNRSTLQAAKDFEDRKKQIMQEHDITQKDIREYLNGEKMIDDPELKRKIDELEAIREEAISNEMKCVVAKAHRTGIEIPEKYINGKALDPFLEPDLVSFSNYFSVYELFSYYDELEQANLVDNEEYEPLHLDSLKRIVRNEH